MGWGGWGEGFVNGRGEGFVNGRGEGFVNGRGEGFVNGRGEIVNGRGEGSGGFNLGDGHVGERFDKDWPGKNKIKIQFALAPQQNICINFMN